MESKFKLLVFAIIISAGCFSCKNGSASTSQKRDTYEAASSQWRCGLYNEIIKEDSIIGVWQTDFRSGGHRKDTLVINEGGRYYQIFSSSQKGIEYTSEWHSWWLEQRDSGGYYLHFENMKYCGGALGTCLDPGDSELSFYDFCEDTWVEMNKEFILSVVWDDSVPFDLRLRHMKPIGYDTYFVNYIKIE